MPVTLGLISHRACALGLPKGKIQYMADLAQNWAETGLGGFWDLGKCQGNRVPLEWTETCGVFWNGGTTP